MDAREPMLCDLLRPRAGKTCFQRVRLGLGDVDRSIAAPKQGIVHRGNVDFRAIEGHSGKSFSSVHSDFLYSRQAPQCAFHFLHAVITSHTGNPNVGSLRKASLAIRVSNIRFIHTRPLLTFASNRSRSKWVSEMRLLGLRFLPFYDRPADRFGFKIPG